MLFHNLETERLILKNIGTEDRDFIFKEFSNDDINKYLFDAEPFTSVEDADELIKYYLEMEPRNQHRWILVRKEDGEKIGTCGFHCWNRERGYCEVGWDLYPDFWKQGYMSEAVGEILKFAKENMSLKEIEADVYSENVNSIAMAQRFNFVDSGNTKVYTFRGEDYIHKTFLLTCENNCE